MKAKRQSTEPEPEAVATRSAAELEHWIEHIQKLAKIASKSWFMIGDTLVSGFEQFGEQPVLEACAKVPSLSGLPLAQLWDVARKLPPSARNALLSWRHHQLALALPGEKAQDTLRQCELSLWTADELRDFVASETAKPAKVEPAALAAAARVERNLEKIDLHELSDVQIREILPRLESEAKRLNEICEEAKARLSKSCAS